MTNLFDGLNKLSLATEWFNIVNVTEIVNMGDQGNMGIYSARNPEFISD
jgi:hypothetical protein